MPADSLTASLSWLAAICYTVQIYFDFSGYSDMAIGLARMFGFHFPENFDHPYVASSVTDFWRRWHISLSRWFRDYLYVPLGGNRVGALRMYCNLAVTFVLCGMWHGANWGFVVWGAFHGTLLILERARLVTWSAWPWPLRHAAVLTLVIVGWVIFRADTLTQACAMLRAMTGFGAGDGSVYALAHYLTPELQRTLAISVVAATPFPAKAWASLRGRLAPGGSTLAAADGLTVDFSLFLYVFSVRQRLQSSGARAPSQDMKLNDQMKERLRALGYTQ